MYKNRKYRSGTSTLVRSTTSDTGIIKSTTSNAVANVSNTQENSTSTTITSSRVLTDRANVIQEEEDVVGPIPRKRLRGGRSPKRRSVSPDSIPSSQIVPVNCYVSQRSTLHRTQSVLSGSISQRNPLSYFERVLQKCGLILSLSTTDTYTLTCDHLQFVIALRNELQANAQFPENTPQFLTGLQESMKTQKQFIKLLTGCAIQISDVDTLRPSQESVLQDMLMIDFLQVDIVTILLERIKRIACDEKASHLEIELILSQLKFVDHFGSGNNVCQKIIEILRMSEDAARETIIRSLQDIIEINKHNEIVKALIEILPSDKDLLTITNIDTFGSMAISVDYHTEISNKIIHYMKSGANIELWPSFIKFILNYTKHNAETLGGIIKDLRSCLKWGSFIDVDPQTRVDLHKNQIEVFNCITRSLIRSKQLFDTWLKVIQTIDGDHERFKSIDLIIILMMMSIKDDKCVYIENVIRRKIKAEVLKPKMLEDLIDKYPAILIEYFSIFFELMDPLLRDKNQTFVQFASTAFKCAFRIENSDHKMLLSKLTAFVCEKRVTTATNRDSGASVDVTTNALMILLDINKKYPIEMQKNSFQILRILDYASDMTLAQYRIVMDILCSLAYMTPQCDVLKDHIDMMVKKQVSSSIRSVKNRGIIGVVRIVEHIIWEDSVHSNEMDVDMDDSFNSIRDIPAVQPRTAATYVDMLISSTLSCPYQLALVFDEMSTMFQNSNKKLASGRKGRINKQFLVWISDLTCRYFEENFIVEEKPNGYARLQLDFFYSLNTLDELHSEEEEDKTVVAIGIAGSVLKDSSNALSTATILPSLFNLLRILQSCRHSGLLDSIDALLGTPILLPSIMGPGTHNDIFDEFNEDIGKQILDMYFHTVNFWRECVSAYVSQQNLGIRTKVLTRLTEIIRFEAKILELLKSAPDEYTPPICHFLTTNNNLIATVAKFKKPTAPAKKARKKASPKTQNLSTTNIVDTENMPATIGGELAPDQITGRLPPKKLFDDTEAGDFFRPMDPNVIQLFEEPLILKYPLTQETTGTALGLLEFKFLMEDLILKIEKLFGIRSSCSQQDIPYPADFIFDLVEILPKIMGCFNKLSQHMKQIVDGVDETGLENCSQMFTEETNYIKTCFGQCLRLLSGLYTWSGFDEEVHQELLKNSLRSITANLDHVDSSVTENIVLAAIESIIGNMDIVMELKAAVNMLKLVRSLVKHINDNKAYEQFVVKLCKNFLSRHWLDQSGNEERGVQCNVHLDELLNGYFQDAKFSFISRHVTWIQEETEHFENSKSDAFKTFPCITRNNFSVLFRVVFASLVSTMERKIDKNAQHLAQLKLWESSQNIIIALLDIVKKLDTPRIFSLFLKYSHLYLKIFLLHGMPVVENLLRKNGERVLEFLKSLQVTTRFLHNLCCHSKAIKNTVIIAQIPALRETVEQFVFKVKAALAANNCSSVFTMGNLKNKNLYGEEMSSQASSITRTLTDDDDDDGVTDRTDDDIAEIASNVPTIDGNNSGHISTNENDDDDNDDDEDEAEQPSTSKNVRSRRSKVGPNRSRSRELTFNRK